MFGYQVLGFGVGGGGPALTVSYVTTVASVTDGTSFTFSGASIGAETAARVVIMAIGAGSGVSTAMTITGVTVAGNAATEQVTIADSGGTDTERSSIYAIAVPSGTTADIVVTTSHTARYCAVAVYIADLASITKSASATNTVEPIVMSIDVAAGGFVIATGQTRNDGGSNTYTVTGLTEDIDYDYGGGGDDAQFVAAHTNFSAAQTGLSITLDNSAAVGLHSGCAVAYNP